MKENRGLHEIFVDFVKRYPRKPALIDIDRDKAWTFQELNDLSNQFANYFHVSTDYLFCIVFQRDRFRARDSRAATWWRC
jgi:acyl-CoA synthetase (AMP-forming)/AMP-acid ligase II